MKRGEETRNAEFRNKNDTSRPAVRREPKLEGKVVGNFILSPNVAPLKLSYVSNTCPIVNNHIIIQRQLCLARQAQYIAVLYKSPSCCHVNM